MLATICSYWGLHSAAVWMLVCMEALLLDTAKAHLDAMELLCLSMRKSTFEESCTRPMLRQTKMPGARLLLNIREMRADGWAVQVHVNHCPINVSFDKRMTDLVFRISAFQCIERHRRNTAKGVHHQNWSIRAVAGVGGEAPDTEDAPEPLLAAIILLERIRCQGNRPKPSSWNSKQRRANNAESATTTSNNLATIHDKIEQTRHTMRPLAINAKGQGIGGGG